MSIELIDDWMDVIFDVSQSEIGQRLGVPFMRAQAESVNVFIDINESTSSSSDNAANINITEVSICQSSLGVLGISTVVWDAGLYLIDFLIHEQNLFSMNKDYTLGRVLDIGCGTGICGNTSCNYLTYLLRLTIIFIHIGIIAAYLKSDYILLTDAHISDIVIQNIEQMPPCSQDKINTLKFDWNNDNVPEMLISPTTNNNNDNDWDTILCSDILYDSKYHAVLLRLISMIKFRRLILSYKRRHDEEEKQFLVSLAEKYSIKLVNPDHVKLKNLNKASLSGLHLLVCTPK